MAEETQSRKKILYIITKSNFGGAQKHVYDLATGMPKESFEVAVALGGNGLLKEKLVTAGIRTISIHKLGRDISLFKDGASLMDIFSIIKDEKPDVVHLHSPKAAGLGALSARLLGVKNIIYTVHGWAFNEDCSFIFKTLRIFFSWLTMILCHVVINITEKETDQSKKFPFVSKKIMYIPNGITPPSYLSKEEARHFFEQRLNITLDDKIMLGTIAELHKNKGLPYAIQALSKIQNRINNLVFIIVGDGEEKDYLQTLIAEKKLENIVYLAGFIKDAATYLKGFDIFTLTSIKEGLPYVILEAGAAALPCVTTSVGGVADIITDMKSGILVKPKNVDEIAEGITYIIEHPQRAQEFSQTLQQKVLTDFNKEKMLERISKVY